MMSQSCQFSHSHRFGPTIAGGGNRRARGIAAAIGYLRPEGGLPLAPQPHSRHNRNSWLGDRHANIHFYRACRSDTGVRHRQPCRRGAVVCVLPRLGLQLRLLYIAAMSGRDQRRRRLLCHKSRRAARPTSDRYQTETSMICSPSTCPGDARNRNRRNNASGRRWWNSGGAQRSLSTRRKRARGANVFRFAPESGPPAR
jgi:hypothetical protein